MIRQLQKLGLFTASTALGIALIDLNPVQAASFEFTIGDNEYGDTYGVPYGVGSLDFDLSPLTGKDTETISFNQLYQYWNDNNTTGLFASPEFNYLYKTNLPISDSPRVTFSGSNQNAIFTFNLGELVGIEFDNIDSESFGSVDGRSGDIYYTDGIADFSFKGASAEVFITSDTEIYEIVSVPIYDENGEYIGDELQEQFVRSRHSEYVLESQLINFKTIEPVEAVPEPLTMLGAATALGFGTFFKRKLSKK